MIGSSRASLAEVQELLNEKYRDPDAGRAGRELLEIADLLVSEKPLLNALSDSGRPAGERSQIVASLLAERVCPLALEIAQNIVTQRWSSESDLIDTFEIAGAQAMFGACEDAGDLDRVEEELFRFGRIVDANGDLQLALSSPGLPAQTKRGILVDLLGGKVTDTTVDLVSYICSHLRGRRIEQALETFTELAAERRGQLLAVVRSAIALTQDQQDRLGAALQRLYEQPIAINVEIDPSLMGGLTVEIGEDVIDGSIANRLENARRRVAG